MLAGESHLPVTFNVASRPVGILLLTATSTGALSPGIRPLSTFVLETSSNPPHNPPPTQPAIMSTSQDPSRRAARLQGIFREVISGKRPVRSPHDGQLFLEAVRGQHSPSQCVEVLVSSTSGLDAVRDAVRADLSVPFILSHTLPFLRYLADPSIKTLVDGQLLRQVLLVVTNPPTVLNALMGLFNSRQIPEDALYPFAWLTLELISLPPEAPVDVAKVVECVSDGQQFLKCQDHTTRELGYKIQKVAQIRCSPSQGAQPGGPGGRHDNDFAQFRQIRIYPTTDEFLSTQPPYYQTSAEVFGTEIEERPRVHLDNQFRLLREDMLAELREDIQVATGKKKGKRSALVLGSLVPVGIDVGDATMKRYRRCTLLLACHSGPPWLQGQDVAARRKMLKDQPSLLKHQAFGVLRRNNEILGFAFVNRDIDNLAMSPPIVSLQFTDHDGLRRALKSKVDTALRQGISMASERFSCSMLGNPGTGMSPFVRRCSRTMLRIHLVHRQNHGGACVRQAPHGPLCHSRLVLQRDYWSLAGKYRGVRLQRPRR